MALAMRTIKANVKLSDLKLVNNGESGGERRG
jgi:hypothetical protein